ncbi:MAG: hypothetical protein J7L42_04050 [Elusimicrobia bacterium]|nr:hypothetical protein [Elusimicrobiota bacterium]
MKVFSLKLKIFLNSLASPSRPIKSFIFAFLGILFMTGIYLWLKRIFTYIVNVPFFGEAILIRFLSILIFISGGIAVLSTVISATATIYTSDELKMLLPLPLSSDEIFLAKMFEAFIYADWMIFLLSIVVAFAWRSIYEIGVFEILFCGISLVFFIFAMSSIGVFLSNILAFLFPTRKIRDFSVVIFAILFGGIFFYMKALEPEFLLKANAFENFLEYLTHLKFSGTLLSPFRWLAMLFIEISKGNFSDAFVLFLVLFLFFLFFFSLSFFFGSKTFLSTTTRINARGAGAGIYQAKLPGKKEKIFMWREKVLFLRNSEQVSQVAILLILITIYLVSVWRAPVWDIPSVKNLLTFLNIGGVCLILSATALRFIFTSICLEGRGLWIIFSSPILPEKILKLKFYYFLKYMGVSGFILGILSGVCWKASFEVVLITAVITLISSLTITSLAFYFALSYPVYSTTNISRMESSYGGVLFMISSVFYIVFVLAVLAYPALWYFTGVLFRGAVERKFTLIFFAGFFLISLGIVLFLFRRGVKIFTSRWHRNLFIAHQ